MTDQTPSHSGQIVWHDLMTTDLSRAKEFYQALFGWTVDKYEMGDLGYYGIFKCGDQAVAGMLRARFQVTHASRAGCLTSRSRISTHRSRRQRS